MVQADDCLDNNTEVGDTEHPTTFLPGSIALISCDGRGGYDDILSDNHPSEDEHEEESEDEHYYSGVEIQVHDEQPQLMEAAVPVGGEEQSLESEDQMEPPASGKVGSSPDMIRMTIYMLSGELVCEHHVRASDLYTIGDLKCFIAHKVSLDPLMIILTQEQAEEPLDNGFLVSRLSSASQAHHLFFTAVFSCTSKAYVRDQLILQSDCAPDDASWPSIDVPWSPLSQYCLKSRPNEWSECE